MLVVTAAQTASLFVSGFASHLADRGHRVIVVADSLGSLEAGANKAGIELEPIPMRRNPSPWHDLRSLITLLAVIRHVQPDVITYATPKASLIGSIAGRLAGTKTRVYQLWGLRLETMGGLSRWVLGVFERLTSWLSTSIVANSPSLAQRYLDLSLNAGREVDVLGSGSSHGVDLQRFSRDAPIPELEQATANFLGRNAGLVVGFVGRLHVDKGLLDLKEAVRLCHQEGHRIQLLLVGPDEGIGDRIVEDDDDLSIHLAGETDDPRPYLAVMDVLCLPSHREGFPNVVLEAGAMGVPAVVSNATGAVDSVVPGVTGMVTPVRDPAQLARALSILATDPQLLNTLGRGALNHVRTNFDQYKVWNDYARYLLK